VEVPFVMETKAVTVIKHSSYKTKLSEGIQEAYD
jgi:hypothetical protein